MDITPSQPAAPTLAPPTLTLEPPAPVPMVEPQQAAGMLPVKAERRTELQRMAAAKVDELAALTPNSPEMTAAADELADLGRDDLMRAGAASNHMLQRPAAALQGNSGKDLDTPQGRVSKTLADLRHTVEDLSPQHAGVSKSKRILGIIPVGRQLDRYFDRYRSAQSQLDAITRALVGGQDELRKDNAAIDTERAELWSVMEQLTEWAIVLEQLDTAAEAKRQQLAVTQPQLADAFQSQLLYAVRQRRTDVLTQLAASAQSYLAMDMVRKNNQELIRGVDRARSTTMAALRTAIIVSQALASQKLVLEQISALNATTSDLIASNAAMLRQQGGEIQKQAADSTIELAKLEAAFTDVFAAMDELDAFRAQAATNLQTTVASLEQQLVRAKPYLERSATSQQR